MIHTPDTAREAVREIIEWRGLPPAGQHDWYDSLYRDIAAAILKAQADALEEAAKLTAEFDEEVPDEPPPEMRWWPQDAIAAAIRALIPKGAALGGNHD